MKYLFTFFACIAFLYPAKACINEYAIDAHGHEHVLDDYSIQFKPFDESKIKERLKSIEKSLEENYRFEDHSDYAVNILKLGYAQGALEIFKELYLLHPNEYNIIANLGTAYELVGEVDSALKYIKLGIVVNPYSHYSSEWVHVRILEIKQLNPSLDQLKIFDLDTSNFDTLSKLTHQIQYQLEERMPFTPLDNIFMAKMLEEAGDYQANFVSLTRSPLYYEMAKLYYPGMAAGLDKKIDRVDSLLKQYRKTNKKATGRNKTWEKLSLTPLKKHSPLVAHYKYKTYEVK